jgi:hypothetical protein
MDGQRECRSAADWAAIARKLRESIAGPESAFWSSGSPADAALTDQLKTAANETRARRASDLSGLNLKTLPSTPALLDLLRGQYLRIIFGLSDSSIAHCSHISLLSPTPGVAVLYRNRIDCDNCFASASRPELSTRETHTCDLCGARQANHEMDMVMSQFGPLTLIAKICKTCSQDS